MLNPFAPFRRLFIRWLMREKPMDNTFPLCDFDALQHEIRQGDVVLIEGRSRVSSVIKMLTKSNWSHAALYIGRLHDIDDLDLREMLKEHIDISTNPRIIIEGILGKGTIASALDHYKGEHIRICRPKKLTYSDVQKVIAHMITALGRPYKMRHIIDLARFLLPWSILPRRWGSSLFAKRGEFDGEVCSVTIADAFQNISYPILPEVIVDEEGEPQMLPRNARLFTPSDFDYSPYFDIIKYPMFETPKTLAFRQRMWRLQQKP